MYLPHRHAAVLIVGAALTSTGCSGSGSELADTPPAATPGSVVPEPTATPKPATTPRPTSTAVPTATPTPPVVLPPAEFDFATVYSPEFVVLALDPRGRVLPDVAITIRDEAGNTLAAGLTDSNGELSVRWTQPAGDQIVICTLAKSYYATETLTWTANQLADLVTATLAPAVYSDPDQ